MLASDALFAARRVRSGLLAKMVGRGADWLTRGHGDAGTRGRGDAGTRGRGEGRMLSAECGVQNERRSGLWAGAAAAGDLELRAGLGELAIADFDQLGRMRLSLGCFG